ncbi:hypothetical protein LP420_26705 [Massilia sp. B-10]|nr:hypothetical protein LP420_26705 [Massilia sp. B-10]
MLVSTHTRSGIGQFYGYGPDNKLSTIADAGGRTLTIKWSGEAVVSIIGPTGTASYGYERSKSDDSTEIVGTERLKTVDFSIAGEPPFATKSYHYEAPENRHFLTGITDENGIRFCKIRIQRKRSSGVIRTCWRNPPLHVRIPRKR